MIVVLTPQSGLAYFGLYSLSWSCRDCKDSGRANTYLTSRTFPQRTICFLRRWQLARHYFLASYIVGLQLKSSDRCFFFCDPQDSQWSCKEVWGLFPIKPAQCNWLHSIDQRPTKMSRNACEIQRHSWRQENFIGTCLHHICRKSPISQRSFGRISCASMTVTNDL